MIHPYEAKKFSFPEIPGISAKQIEEHLKLYEGYVSHVNALEQTLLELAREKEIYAVLIQEYRRRLGFEFNGMRLHEYYFGDLESGPMPLTADTTLYELLSKQYGNFEQWKETFMGIAARGSGWMILVWDPIGARFHHNWIDEHHIGHLVSLPVVLALDLWEHAYMVDYLPGEKKKYIESYLNAVNWQIVAERFHK